MTRPLLDRQLRLLEYLTSGTAIYRDRRAAPLDANLAGIDRGLLDIEARFSHEKRMEKIAAVLPVTFRLLGDDKEAIVRAFVDACPPTEISRIANAWQLHDFLLARWQREPPPQPYLPDVAACELACAQVRVAADAGAQADPAPSDVPRPAIRRHPGITLLRTAHDIRAVFEGESGVVPARRETLLAIALQDAEPQIFELTAEIFELLQALDRWTAAEGLAGAEALVVDLAAAGLLELCR
jgi:hypothetical protein